MSGQSANYKAAKTLQCILGTADPRNSALQVATPIIDARPSFNQVVQAQLQYRATTEAVVGLEQISPLRGLFMWWPMGHVDAISHCGIVKAKTTGQQFPIGPWNMFSGVQNPFLSIKYTKELALPYIGDKQIITGPVLEDEIMLARVYSGIFDVSSQSVPTGNYTINGLMAGAVVNDTTRIAQTDQGAFSNMNLITQSATAADAVKQVGVVRGITTIQGSSIANALRAPERAASDTIDAVFSSFNPSATYTDIDLGGGGFISDDWYGKDIVLQTMWVTPRDCTLNVIGSGNDYPNAGNNHENVQMTQIGERDQLDFKLTANVHITTSKLWSGSDKTALYTIKAMVQHTYAGVSSKGGADVGAAEYKLVNEAKILRVADSWNDERATGTGGDYSATVEFSPRITTDTGYNGRGKYLGSAVAIVAVLTGSGQPSAGSVKTDANGLIAGLQTFAVENLRLDVRARNFNSLGMNGPCNIVSYDEISPDTVLSLNGRFNCEIVPLARVNTYTQKSVENQDHAFDMDIIPILTTLYDGASPFKRMFTTDDYRDFLRSLHQKASPEYLMDVSRNHPRLSAMFESAGLFHRVFSAIPRALAPSHIAKPLSQVAGHVGHGIDGWLEDNLGSVGNAVMDAGDALLDFLPFMAGGGHPGGSQVGRRGRCYNGDVTTRDRF